MCLFVSLLQMAIRTTPKLFCILMLFMQRIRLDRCMFICYNRIYINRNQPCILVYTDYYFDNTETMGTDLYVYWLCQKEDCAE